VVSDRAGYQHNIDFPGAGGDEKPKAMDIVVRFIDLLDLAEAGSTSTSVHESDMEGMGEGLPDPVIGVILRGNGSGPFVSRLPIDGGFEAAKTAKTVDTPAVIHRNYLPGVAERPCRATADDFFGPRIPSPPEAALEKPQGRFRPYRDRLWS
jgi:hypothetical protein